jgi:hypothetical protein
VCVRGRTHVLKIRFRQWLFIGRESMPTCPASAKQNDGDKRRENGPGKITTFSVGQGETPTNLLTVIHKRRKRFFTHVAAASHKFFVLVLVLHPRVPVLITRTRTTTRTIWLRLRRTV